MTAHGPGRVFAPDPVPQAGPGTGPLRILLADDNVDFVQSVALLLEASGYIVEVHHDGALALAHAPAFRPDLCFLDIGLPGLNGFELARRLRALPATQTAILVAVTGWGQPEDRQRSRDAGFHHHLAKPVEFDQLIALLDSIYGTSAPP